MIKNLAIVLALATMSAGHRNIEPRTEYHGHDRCGIPTYDIPPTAIVRADIDKDGELDHFYARSGIIERHKMIEVTFSDGEKFYFSADIEKVYESSYMPFSCADIRLKDLDDDGDLDLVYASTLEVVVMKNKDGRLEIEQDIGWDLEPTTRPRIKFERVNGTLSIVPYQELKK